MTVKTEFEREADILLFELEDGRTKANRRAELAIKAAQEIERKVSSVRETVAIYREYHGLAQPEIEIDEVLRREFEGLTTKDTLMLIAAGNKGILEGSAASKTLVMAGIFKDEKNASSAVYSTIKRHPGTFRKLARGKYQLLTRVSQTVTIPYESLGTVTEPIGPMKDDDDPWTTEEDKSPPEVTPVPEQLSKR